MFTNTIKQIRRSLLMLLWIRNLYAQIKIIRITSSCYGYHVTPSKSTYFPFTVSTNKSTHAFICLHSINKPSNFPNNPKHKLINFHPNVLNKIILFILTLNLPIHNYQHNNILKITILNNLTNEPLTKNININKKILIKNLHIKQHIIMLNKRIQYLHPITPSIHIIKI